MSTQQETSYGHATESGAETVSLVIDTFDHWADTGRSALYPSNICWCRTDLVDNHELAG